MKTKDFQQAYLTPVAEVVEIGVISVLCGSQDGIGGSSTEQLGEEDLSGMLW